MDERIRVLVAGPGTGGADRAAEVLARALRDAGMEVVYTDRPPTPEQLVATVVQEDVDAVGLAVAEGADAAPVLGLAGRLTEQGDDVAVFVTGGAPAGDGADGRGVPELFGREAAPADVVAWLRGRIRG